MVEVSKVTLSYAEFLISPKIYPIEERDARRIAVLAMEFKSYPGVIEHHRAQIMEDCEESALLGVLEKQGLVIADRVVLPVQTLIAAYDLTAQYLKIINITDKGKMDIRQKLDFFSLAEAQKGEKIIRLGEKYDDKILRAEGWKHYKRSYLLWKALDGLENLG